MGLIVAVSALAIFLLRTPITNFYEDVAYTLDPSAERAFQYGARHFSSDEPVRYDIDRAEHFFDLAALKDPTIPYLYHQLARISFLRGDFTRAMAQIDYQIQMHGDAAPNSYYVRGLIEGFMGDYDAAARDYAYFLKLFPSSWAGANDYAWVLLKADRPKDAAEVTEAALRVHPTNAWLLSTHAIALYEIGDLAGAVSVARQALVASSELTVREWLRAYPGNDPQVAREGLATHRKSIEDNIHTIEAVIANGAVQSE